MKYLVILLTIVCGASLVTLFFVWPTHHLPPKGVVVTVNGHALTKSAIMDQQTALARPGSDYSELLDSAITRELLLQEAQHQHIDQEESFRKTLKNFYEQSLIKILLDREYRRMQVQVSEAEIDRYLSLFGKKITFTRIPLADGTAKTAITAKAVENEVLFDDLADSMRYILSSLKPGEQMVEYDTDNERYAIRLDQVTPAQGTISSLPKRDKVRKLIDDNKRQVQIGSWLDTLRQKASITMQKGKD